MADVADLYQLTIEDLLTLDKVKETLAQKKLCQQLRRVVKIRRKNYYLV